MAMYRLSEAMHKMEALLVMVVVQVAFAGVTILYKLTASNGMNLILVVAYRFIFAMVFMAPLAFFLERKSRPKITWTVLVQAFFCGLFGGSMGQILYLASISMTSATYVSAMANLTPAVTFVLAISFGLEKARLRTVAGKAKVAGTLMGIGGAMLLTFYKGVEVNLWSTHVNLLRHVASTQQGQEGSSNLPPGIAFGRGQLLLLRFLVDHSGGSRFGLCYTLMAWCVRVRGPVFVSAFSPLMLVIVALAGSLVLDEKLNLGSILGSGLIVLGLYAVLWGKRKENEKMNQLVPSSSPNESESIEIFVASPNKNGTKEGDDVQELAQKESEVIQERPPNRPLPILLCNLPCVLSERISHISKELVSSAATATVFPLPRRVSLVEKGSEKTSGPPRSLVLSSGVRHSAWRSRPCFFICLGVVGSGLGYTLMAWCIRVRGPVFVSAFNPLMLVIVALAGSMVLDEKLHLGSILGSGLIVLGLYTVLWGKRKENKKMNHLVPSSNPNESESVEIFVASSNKNGTKEGDDVQELAQKESEVIQESFEGKRGGGGGERA
ncbi:hypothetical protein NL676_039433 [Syzygium grande]|nr:hypothetical protein NL676_039433 [Syzygium grande]